MLSFATIPAMNSNEHLSGQCDYFKNYARTYQLETTKTKVPHGYYFDGEADGSIFLRMTVPVQSSLMSTIA